MNKLIIALIFLSSNYLLAADQASLKQQCFTGNKEACLELDRTASNNIVTKEPAKVISDSTNDLNKDFSESVTACANLIEDTKKQSQKEHLLSTLKCSGKTIATPTSNWKCVSLGKNVESSICPEKMECKISYRCIQENDDYNRDLIRKSYP